MSVRKTVGQRDGAAFFGQEVKFAREHKGMTQQQLAEAAQYERPYVTRVEGGTLFASELFAAACDRVFDTSGFFVRLRERVSERGHPGWFVPYVNLEREATSILDYSPMIIPGILQTRDYAMAVFRQAHPLEEWDALVARVDARLARREALAQANPPLLWVVLGEAAMRTVIGNAAVMADQLEYVLAQAESPHIAIQVLPYAQGTPAGDLPFVLLTQAEGSTILYAETPQRAHVEDSEAVVGDRQSKYDRLRAAAMPPDDSLVFIRDLMKEYTDEQHP